MLVHLFKQEYSLHTSVMTNNRPFPKVTVVIVNWNGEKFIERCLTALLRQTIPPHEIIFVDNASTDKSLEIIKSFPSVRLLAQEKNHGFARGNNLAIKMASIESEWIALLNPDAFVEPEWLEALVLSTQKNPSFDFFGSKLLNASTPEILDGIGDVYHISGLVWRSGHGKMASDYPEEESEIFSPCAAAALYRTSALKKVNYFDEDYFCYVEDVDLGFRLRLAGYKCLYVPTSIVHHVGSGTTGGQHSDFAVYHGHRNLVWTYVKNMPALLFWFFLPMHLAMNLIILIVFTLRNKKIIIFRSKRDALMNFSKMWTKRQEIQNNRIVSTFEVLRVLKKN